MGDAPWWKAALSFVLTSLAIYGVVSWLGPAGVHETIMVSGPVDITPSLASVFALALAVNAIWCVVLLLPSRRERAAPT